MARRLIDPATMTENTLSRQGPSVVLYKPPRDVSDDKVLRTMFRYFLRDLVEIFYADIACDLDFREPVFLNGKLFADYSKKGHVRPDLAVQLATVDADWPFVIFHAELENAYTGLIEQRLKIYLHQIALEYGDLPVFALALFKTGSPEAVEEKEVVRGLRSRVSNRYYYLSVNLSKCLAEDYLKLPQSVVPGLAALMKSKVWDRVEQKVRCLEAVRRTKLDDGRRYLLTNMIDIYLALDEEEHQRYQRELDKIGRKEVKEMVLTFQEALAESKAEGVIEGEIKGEIKEARKAVRLVGEHRWGSLPDEFVAKLDAVNDLDRLHRAMEQALKVGSIDEIDLDPTSSEPCP